jgi:hypothetical protein
MQSRLIQQKANWTEYYQDIFGNTGSTTSLRDEYEEQFNVTNTGNVLPVNRKMPHAHSYSKYLIKRFHGSKSVYGYPSGGNLAQYNYGSGNFGTIPQFAPVSYAVTAYNTALSKLYERLRGSIDLSIDVGQRQQTIAMARKIAKVVSYVKSHPIAALKKSHDYFKANGLKTIGRDGGSLWLEYTYGLKPTVSTLFDITVELARSQEPLLKAVGRATAKQRVRVIYSPSQVAWAKETSDQTWSNRYHIECIYRHTANTLNLLGQFTSLNPASIAWELLPFSFVADWFYDVGGYMRNLETAILTGSQFAVGFQTDTTSYEHIATVSGATSDPGGYSSLSLSSGYQIYRYFNRAILVSSPLPRAPQFNTDLSSGRLLNAAALLSQFLKK